MQKKSYKQKLIFSVQFVIKLSQKKNQNFIILA